MIRLTVSNEKKKMLHIRTVDMCSKQVCIIESNRGGGARTKYFFEKGGGGGTEASHLLQQGRGGGE